MVVPFSQFGSDDAQLYRDYLFSLRTQVRCVDCLGRSSFVENHVCRINGASHVGVGSVVGSVGVDESGVPACVGWCRSSVVCVQCCSAIAHCGFSSASLVSGNKCLEGVKDKSSDLSGQLVDDCVSNGGGSPAVVEENCVSSGLAVETTVVCDTSSSSVSERTLANRQKRAKKKERKLRKQAKGFFGKDGVDDTSSGSVVPEWRRKTGLDAHRYRGAFELCDEDTRRKLAETRAKRLISENEACVRKAQVESDRWSSTVKLQRKQEDLQMLKVGKQIEALRSSGVEAIQEDLEQRRLSQQLRIAQSRQKLELIAAQDLESLKRRQASKVLKDTETNKVAVERAFGTLAGTGNVPSLVGGKVCTINSGSISPNSSASEAEVRAIQKKNLDLEKRVEELTAELGKLRTATGERQDYDGYDYSEGVTIDEDGHPIGDFGDYSGYIGRDNRFHFGESMMPYFD